MDELKYYSPKYQSASKVKGLGKNAITNQFENRALIMRLINEKGVISRKDLAAKSGLQPATVTIIVQELMNSGLLYENGMLDGGNGRRVKGVSLVNNRFSVGVRITDNYIKFGLYNLNYENMYIDKYFVDTVNNMDFVVDYIVDKVNTLKEQYQDDIITGVGIGVEHTGKIINNDYACWDNKKQEYVFLGSKIHDKTHLPVFVNRAINFGGYEMWRKCMTSDYGMMVYFSLGYAIECCVVLNGEIVNGKDGCGGMFGEMIVDFHNQKTLNEQIAVGAILERARKSLEKYPDSLIKEKMDNLNIRDIIHAYDEKDELAREVYHYVAEHFARILTHVILLLNPDYILLGDEIPTSEDFKLDVRKSIAAYLGEEKAQVMDMIRVERKSELDPGLIGGARYVNDMLISIGQF